MLVLGQQVKLLLVMVASQIGVLVLVMLLLIQLLANVLGKAVETGPHANAFAF